MTEETQKKDISRKDFLKQTACIALCPFIISSLTSCGEEEKKPKNNDKPEGKNEASKGTKIEASEYSSMTVGTTKSLELEGLEQGILLHKKSETEFLVFNATCPHQGFKVDATDSGNTMGTCSSGHGGTFSDSGTGLTPPVEGVSLVKYSVSVMEDHLLVKV